MDIYHYLKKLSLVFLVLNLSACSTLLSNTKKEFAENLSATIATFDDLETIEKAVPSYLILISSLIKGDPGNIELLNSGAKLYGAYASAFAQSVDSKKALSKRALSYASRAMCLQNTHFCETQKLPLSDYEKNLQQLKNTQVDSLFIFASSWAGVIEANSSDWSTIAQLPKVKASIKRVLELDDKIDNGNAHIYMAVIETLLPASLGGKPAIAKNHFEQALKISDGKNLMAKVLYAEKYARSVFDKTLHDKLLKQVLESENEKSKTKLIDLLAKKKAKKLLLESDDYF